MEISNLYLDHSVFLLLLAKEEPDKEKHFHSFQEQLSIGNIRPLSSLITFTYVFDVLQKGLAQDSFAYTEIWDKMTDLCTLVHVSSSHFHRAVEYISRYQIDFIHALQASICQDPQVDFLFSFDRQKYSHIAGLDFYTYAASF